MYIIFVPVGSKTMTEIILSCIIVKKKIRKNTNFTENNRHVPKMSVISSLKYRSYGLLQEFPFLKGDRAWIILTNNFRIIKASAFRKEHLK
jgi:hypothetical protein